MQILEVKSVSDKDAVKSASQILNIEPDAIEAKLHIKGGGGFLGLGSKEPSVYKIFTIAGKTPVNAVISAVVMQITRKMGYNVKVDAVEKTDEDKLYVTMSSSNAGHIIGKRGKTLESLQFIVNLMVQQFIGEPPKILLDIENYRKRREKYLTEMATRMAEAVVKYGKSRLLEPLNPFERRLIHVALQEDDRVETESEGVGVYKRVRIFVKSANPETEKEHSTDHDEFSPDENEERLTNEVLVASEKDENGMTLSDDNNEEQPPEQYNPNT